MKNKKMKLHALLGAIVIASMLLASCSQATTTPAIVPTDAPIVEPTEPSATVPTDVPTALPTEIPEELSGNVVVMTWAGYDADMFTEPFYAMYPDLTIDHLLITADTEAFTKIQTGTEADVICVTWEKSYIDENLVQPIDISRIEAWDSIPEPLKEKGTVDGIVYFVPFNWGYSSILVRTDKVTTIPKSYNDLWNPEYAGHVGFYDTPEIGAIYASFAMGIDYMNTTPEQDEDIKQKNIDLKPNILTYFNDPYAMMQMVADGDLWVVAGAWPSSVPILGAQDIPVEYTEPEEGRLLWTGGMGIPTNAPNLDAAYAYINYMLSPEAQANLGGAYYLGPANSDAIPLIDPALVAAMGFDDLDMMARSQLQQDVSIEKMQQWNEMWTEVKAAP